MATLFLMIIKSKKNNKQSNARYCFVLNGATNLPKSELFKIVDELKPLFNHEFILDFKWQLEVFIYP